MKNDFYQKMAELQQYQQPAQPLPARAGQNNRITVDDVRARGISAAIFGLLAFFGTLTLSITFNFHWLLALGAGLVVFGWFYFSEMTDAKQYQAPISPFPLFDYQKEMLPQPTITRITAEVKTQNGLQIAEFDADPTALKSFAQKVTLHRAGFSEKTAQKCGITQEQFNQMRDQFLKANWAEWKNPGNHRLGVNLLPAGVAWLEKAGE